MRAKMAHSQKATITPEPGHNDMVLGVAQIPNDSLLKSKPSSESYTFYEQIMSGSISPAQVASLAKLHNMGSSESLPALQEHRKKSENEDDKVSQGKDST